MGNAGDWSFFGRRSALFLGLAFVAGASWAQANGVTNDRLLIGQSITLQGGKNAYGVAVQDGIATYLKVVNEQGGIHGRQVV
ncbi:MAG: hypothetical protein AVDCRST_MAG51-2140, partial [uncultured Ramlibacter sp.]